MTTAFVNFGQTDGFGVPGRENDRSGKFREIYLSDGNSAFIECKDPYGFWFIRWDNGKTPKDVSDQAFTSAASAIQWLNLWLQANRYDTKISEKKVIIPEPQLKKVRVDVKESSNAA